MQDNFVFPNRAMSPSLPYRLKSNSYVAYQETSSSIVEGHPIEYKSIPSTPSHLYNEHFASSPSSRGQYNGFGNLPKTPSTPYGGISYLPETPGTPYGGFGVSQGLDGIHESLLEQGDNLIKRRMIHSRARSSGLF